MIQNEFETFVPDLGPLPAASLGVFLEIVIMKGSISIAHVAKRVKDSPANVQKAMQVLHEFGLLQTKTSAIGSRCISSTTLTGPGRALGYMYLKELEKVYWGYVAD